LPDFKLWQTRDGVQPPALVPMLGKRVERAWLTPSRKLFAAKLEDGFFFMADWEPIGDLGGVRFETGKVLPGKDWSDLDEDAPQSAYTEALVGLPFTGLDRDIVTFGEVGARSSASGFQWVRVKP